MHDSHARSSASARHHNAFVLDAEIVYSHWVDRMPRFWWFAPLFIVACGIAGWYATLPLN